MNDFIRLFIAVTSLFAVSNLHAGIDPVTSPYNQMGPYGVNADSTNATNPEALFYYPDNSAQGPFPVLIFQPGANALFSNVINRHTYDLYLQHLASWGYVVVIVDIAQGGLPSGNGFETVYNWFLGKINDPNHWASDYANPNSIYVGGHSFGGVEATAFLLNHQTEIEGIIYFASYPSNNFLLPHDVSNYTGKVLSLAGDEDGSTTPSDARTGFDAYTSADCKTYVLLEGTGHGGFGDYQSSSQPVGTLGRAAVSGSIRHYLLSFLESEAKNNATAELELNDPAKQPNSTLQFVSSCGSVPPTTSIGHITLSLNDPNRSNRDVGVEIYYPSEQGGDNVPVLGNDLPLIVFAHGYLVGWDTYENFWQEVVPRGYVMAFLTTGMELFPDRAAYAVDAAFAADYVQELSLDQNSIFFNKLNDKLAFMGHSMGGGAVVNGNAAYGEIDALVLLAPSESTPLPSQTAPNLTTPTLIFSGEADAVTPAGTHQLPIFNALASACKTLVSIPGAGHCLYHNENSTCALGETGNVTLTRAKQQQITFRYLLPFFDAMLKADCSAWKQLYDTKLIDPEINASGDCLHVLDASPDVQTDQIRSSRAELNWSSFPGVEGYEIRGNETGNSGYVELEIPPTNPGLQSVNGLRPSTSYFWQARAVCDAESGVTTAWSMEENFTTTCAAPTQLGVSNLIPRSARLEWTHAAGAAGYELRGRQAGGGWIELTISNSNPFYLANNRLNPSTSYEWQIRSICAGGGTSEYSQVHTFTTPSAKAQAAGIEQAIEIYPQPSKGELNLRVPQAWAHVTEVELCLYDLGGTLVQSCWVESVASNSVQLHLPNAGLFLMSISADERTVIRKISISN